MNLQTLAILTGFLFLVLATFSDGSCVALHNQCGGIGYTGSTCCIQPTPLPPYVNFIAPDSNVCKKVNDYYSVCSRLCPDDRPCLVRNWGCSASTDRSTDGRGRQYCGEMSSCTNPAVCYSDPISCVCGGDVPCALSSRPGGCRAPIPDASVPGTDVCGPGAKRCSAFEGEQCGGTGHTAPTTCQPGLKCVEYSKYFSGCARV